MNEVFIKNGYTLIVVACCDCDCFEDKKSKASGVVVIFITEGKAVLVYL